MLKSVIKNLSLLSLFSIGLLGLAACSSTPDCGDSDHPYLSAQQGATLRAPAGSEAPDEDFSTMIPDVSVEANQAAQQQSAIRGCLFSPPKLITAESNDGTDAVAPSRTPQQRPDLPRSDLPKVPVY